MYVKNTGKLFQAQQVAGNKANLPKRAYSTKAKPQAYLTSCHNFAKEQVEKYGKVSPYYEPYLDLNNFEIVEYELVLVTKHKHPLVE